MIQHKRRIDAPDSDDTDVVHPSDWNDNHDVTGLLGLLLNVAPQPDSIPSIKADGTPFMQPLSAPARSFLAATTAALMLSAVGAVGLDSPAFSGSPTAPTPALADRSNRIATMAAIAAARDDLVNGAPGALDTIKELAAALGDDANFAASVTNALASRMRFDAAQTLTTGQRNQLIANAGLGTTVNYNVGVSPNNVPALGGDGKLDAINGSKLVNVSTCYDTKALACADTIHVLKTSIVIGGFYASGDGGGARFRRVSALASGVYGFQSVDGAWWQLAETIVNPLMCGAKGDGATDDAAAINIAITSAYSLGGIVHLPAKYFRIASSISILHSVTVRGTGSNAASNIYPDVGITAFDINTAEPFQLRDFSIAYPSAASNGTYGIYVTAPAGAENARSQISNVYVGYAYNAIYFVRAALWTVRDCYIQNTGNYGIFISNENVTDSGDATITGTTLAGTTSSAIEYQSSSGLRVINNKINGAQFGLRMTWTSGNGADLFVIGNSIEGIGEASIACTHSTYGFGTFLITGNELSGPRGVWVIAGGSGVWANLFNCVGNTYWDGGAHGTAFQFGGLQGFNCTGNTIQCSHPTTTPHYIEATCCDGLIGGSAIMGAHAPSVNLGTRVAVLSQSQKGNVPSVTCSTGYNALYTGIVAFTFPSPFASVPKVVCSPRDGGGGGAVSAFAESVTTTGFNLRATSVSNGGTFSCDWIASDDAF